MLVFDYKGLALSICDFLFPTIWILFRHVYSYDWAFTMASCKNGDFGVYIFSTCLVFASMEWTTMIMVVVSKKFTVMFPTGEIWKKLEAGVHALRGNLKLRLKFHALYALTVLIPQGVARYLIN